ncbi:MAG: MotA/TolQ/ExbB proton channel family protein, partial [Bdellovibrionaceae bacterium]|nr:MotA/TolQ/ExbB proton channel family protein [Pseudobdellovibrionaceae bacterium]
MTSILQFINESGVVGWVIILTGLGSLYVAGERIYHLYFRYAIKSDELMKNVQNLVVSRKID